MREVLAYADNYRHWTGGIGYAAELAVALEGSLTGLYVQEPILPLPAFTAPQATNQLYNAAVEQIDAAVAAESSFRTWVAGRGVRHSRWQVAEGGLLDAIASAGNWHDLLVLGTGGEARWDGIGAVGRVLLTANLPAIVVPAQAPAGTGLETLLVGWNGSPESVRAMHAALPLLRRARRVVLMRGQRVEPYAAIGWKPAWDIEGYLQQNGIGFESQALGADDDHAGEALLEAAARERAGMLVMGAYGRTRFSEWVFGGATRHVIEHTPIPVFMRH